MHTIKNRIKLYHMVEYLGSCLEANLSGESMAMKPRRWSMQIYNSYIGKMSFLFQNFVEWGATL